MQNCIILNKLSRMWTHRCTPGALDFFRSDPESFPQSGDGCVDAVEERRDVATCKKVLDDVQSRAASV